MFNFKRISLALSVMAVVGLTGALMVGPVSASDTLDTVELTGNDNFTVSSPDTLFGNIEADASWNGTITVEEGADVLGNIESESSAGSGGGGTIDVTVGNGNVYRGNIKSTEDDTVTILVISGGVYTGNVEAAVGTCTIDVQAGGVFRGNAENCNFI